MLNRITKPIRKPPHPVVWAPYPEHEVLPKSSEDLDFQPQNQLENPLTPVVWAPFPEHEGLPKSSDFQPQVPQEISQNLSTRLEVFSEDIPMLFLGVIVEHMSCLVHKTHLSSPLGFG